MWEFGFFVMLIVAVVFAVLYFRLTSKLKTLLSSVETKAATVEVLIAKDAKKAYNFVLDELKKVL